MKIAFFGLELMDKTLYQNVLENHEVEFFDQYLTENNMPQAKDFEVISVTVRSEISKKVIEAFPNLKMITVRATGFDKVDVSFAKEKKILVCNVPGYGSHTVAEFTFGLILSLTRHIPDAINQVKIDKNFSIENLVGVDLFGLTLGVIGTGQIGANVIKIAKGFGMEVLSYDLYPNETLAASLGFKYVTFEELLKTSDIVSLHCPLNEGTKHLINESAFSQMKDGAILINTARGGVVDTPALLKALKGKKIAGAAIDVLEKEDYMGKDMGELSDETKSMIEANLELINMSNVLISPHIAFNSKLAQQTIIETTAKNILEFCKGNPVNVVNAK